MTFYFSLFIARGVVNLERVVELPTEVLEVVNKGDDEEAEPEDELDLEVVLELEEGLKVDLEVVP